jgi:hypothetical protein
LDNGLQWESSEAAQGRTTGPRVELRRAAYAVQTYIGLRLSELVDY